MVQEVLINTLRPRRNGQHFADNIFKHIFFNENVWISIKISLKFVPKGPIYNIPALIQIMAWRRPGNKPLSEPMMDSLSLHICVTRPQWVKKNQCHAFVIHIYPPQQDVHLSKILPSRRLCHFYNAKWWPSNTINQSSSRNGTDFICTGYSRACHRRGQGLMISAAMKY